jgi:hypothetical protein
MLWSSISLRFKGVFSFRKILGLITSRETDIRLNVRASREADIRLNV